MGYLLSERGLGSVNQALEWPTKAAANAVNFASHPYDTVVGIGQNIWSAAGSGVDWATSPIPAQGLERAVNKLLAQSDQQAGGLIFDVASGLITAEIGGFAVKWVGGKWVSAGNGAKGGGSSGFSGGKPTIVDDPYSPNAVTERSSVNRDYYGRENAADEFSAGLPDYATHSTAKSY
ncbi:hypothetical protein [Pseudomonas sp. NFACC10-1]|nr:hypothetical protein [Pseudomonas sp. NFACC10-1]SFW68108.1 hypothetical protein SAMN03159505_02780 [Pseudomonas sp. NFACC10-1]